MNVLGTAEHGWRNCWRDRFKWWLRWLFRTESHLLIIWWRLFLGISARLVLLNLLLDWSLLARLEEDLLGCLRSTLDRRYALSRYVATKPSLFAWNILIDKVLTWILSCLGILISSWTLKSVKKMLFGGCMRVFACLTQNSRLNHWRCSRSWDFMPLNSLALGWCGRLVLAWRYGSTFVVLVRLEFITHVNLGVLIAFVLISFALWFNVLLRWTLKRRSFNWRA